MMGAYAPSAGRARQSAAPAAELDPPSRVAEALARQCEIVRQCAELVGVARALADLAADASPLDLARLALVADSTVEVISFQSLSYERWADCAAPIDPLVSRALRRLADALKEAAAAVPEVVLRVNELVEDERDRPAPQPARS